MRLQYSIFDGGTRPISYDLHEHRRPCRVSPPSIHSMTFTGEGDIRDRERCQVIHKLPRAISMGIAKDSTQSCIEQYSAICGAAHEGHQRRQENRGRGGDVDEMRPESEIALIGSKGAWQKSGATADRSPSCKRPSDTPPALEKGKSLIPRQPLGVQIGACAFACRWKERPVDRCSWMRGMLWARCRAFAGDYIQTNQA